MKTLFFGGFAARVAPRILAKMTEKLDTIDLARPDRHAAADPGARRGRDRRQPYLEEGFPEAPRLKLLQSAAAGLDLIDLPSLPRGITLCNVFGHEPAIAEYVLMTMLALTHRLVDDRDGVPRGGSGRPTAPAAARRTARSWARRSASSAMAGSAARSPSARSASAAR